MKNALESIAQDYLRYKKTVEAMGAERQGLPQGNLICRTIQGHCYSYIECKDVNGTRHSKIVSKSETEKTVQLFSRKKFLKESISVFQSYIKLFEKTYPQFKTLTLPQQQDTFFSNANKPYRTYKGDYVRSKSELIIANELYINQIPYEYEKPLFLKGATKPIHPDFTIYTPREHLTIYWNTVDL